MKFIDVFFASSIPVLKVILVTLVGSFIALDRINILGEDARNHLNNVVFYVFGPALIFANLAKTLTFQSLVTLWFMPLNVLITFILGSILGWLLILLTRAPSHLKGLILGCCSAGNLGNMLLIIIPAVCKEKGSPFGNQDVCYKYGMAYASLSTAVASIYIWTYVFNIMRMSSSKNLDEVKINGPVNGVAEEALNISANSCIELPSSDFSTYRDNVDGFSSSYNTPDITVEHSASILLKQKLRRLVGMINLKRLLAPSTVGAMAGFLIGVVPPFRRLLIGENAPLHVIQDSISLLGDGLIPTMSLVMGGNLTKGLKGSRVHISIILGIVLVRYILSPLFGVLIVKGAIRFGLVQSDPLYRFVLLLQYTVPPAMSISTITQLFGAGESECSVIMLWTYALASVSLTMWSIVFIWLVS